MDERFPHIIANASTAEALRQGAISRATHRSCTCVCVFVRAEGGKNGVTAGHSQESLIWTGSSAAEVGGGHGVRG